MLTEKWLFASLGQKLGIMNKRKFPSPSSLRAYLALSLALVLVALVPFGHALEIHHVFSEIDHDGHEHAEHDLCTWVEHHAGGSYVQDFYRAGPTFEPKNFSYHPHHKWVSSLRLRVDRSRAPPLS